MLQKVQCIVSLVRTDNSLLPSSLYEKIKIKDLESEDEHIHLLTKI